MRAVAGLEKLNAGRVLFAGRDITDAPVQGRGMAMIFQTFALYPHLSVRANLAYPLREAGVDRAEIERRVREMAELLRISHTLGRKPTTASGGEQQRIAIGRALIRRPKLLLLDEPLTNLDAKLRHDTRAEFKRLHRELGMTMLYATPDELEALSMGQRIAVIRQGRIVQTGTPDELFDQPVDSFVAAKVGSPPMNLLPATQRWRRHPARFRRGRRWALGVSTWRVPVRHGTPVRFPAARCPSGRGRRAGTAVPGASPSHGALGRHHRARPRGAGGRVPHGAARGARGAVPAGR